MFLKYIKLYLFLVLSAALPLSAQTLTKEELKERVANNTKSFQVNIDTAYQEIESLLEESALLQDTLAQLTLLERTCRYHYNKNNIEELFACSERFQEVACAFKSINDQVMAGVYQAEAYSMNDLNDNALMKLEKALSLLEKKESLSIKDIVTRVNLLSSFANMYEQKGEPENAVRYLMAADDVYVKINDPENVNKFRHVNYSNLANVYHSFNIDSAVHYASLSLNLYSDDENKDNKIVAQNHYILGKGHEMEQEYRLALNNYLTAYDLFIKNGIDLNVVDLYSSIINSYRMLGDTTAVKNYEALLNEYELRTLKEKYKSMHKILYMEQENYSQQQSEKQDYTLIIIICIVIIILLCILVLYFYIKRKKKDRSLHTENYKALMELLKQNNSDFMALFEEIYPDFTKKLLNINPELSRSEIEFCTLLKLNLSTKQISQMRFIEVRTVQNRKYRIRKKLNIPSSVDIYNWFETI